MRFSDLLGTASSSLLRSKARTFLTIIAVFIGAMTITLTNGIGTGIKSYLNQQLGQLGATNVLFITLSSTGTSSNGPTKYTYSPNERTGSAGAGKRGNVENMMTAQDLTSVRSIPGFTDVSAAHSPAPDYIQGTGSKYQLTLSQQYGNEAVPMVAGSNASNNITTNQVSVPESYVGPLGYSSDAAIVGKTVTFGITNAYGTQSIVTATVTGVQQNNLLGESDLYANNALANRLQTVQDEGIPSALANTFETAYAIFPSNYTTAKINSLKSQLSAKGFTGQTLKDEESTIFTAVNVVTIVLDVFSVIALLAASLGIINTLLMSVQERTKEIGLMKALGMSRSKIFTLFSIEAVLIGFWGSLLGVCFAALVGNVANAVGRHGFLKTFPGISLVTFPLTTVSGVILAIMLIAFLAGTLPAIRASRKDPIEALRYE
jgi:putative ABC transport system permease protein